jgi:hypothetical protein
LIGKNLVNLSRQLLHKLNPELRRRSKIMTKFSHFREANNSKHQQMQKGLDPL